MIRVGINENVILTKAELNEEGRLAITFKDGVDDMDAFAQLQEGDITESGLDTTFQIFPPSTKKTTGEDLTKEQIHNDLNNLKNQLAHILGQYRALSASPDGQFAAFKWQPFVGIDAIKDAEAYYRAIVQESFLKQIFTNIATQFIKEISAFAGKTDLKMRLLCIRRSKDKHFATLRNKFLNENPFLEPMTIPKAQSRLKFSKYEIDNGLNLADQITPETSADVTGAAGSVPAADDLPFSDPTGGAFGGGR